MRLKIPEPASKTVSSTGRSFHCLSNEYAFYTFFVNVVQTAPAQGRPRRPDPQHRGPRSCPCAFAAIAS
eukprot:4988532-Pleurochrysis_carterae.AAC.2